MKKHSYPSDLTDSQWEKIAQFFDTKRSRKYPMRQVCNAIIYVVKTGCQWRQLPKEFGAWSSIYYYFDKWRHNGLWERLNDALREAVRIKMGREATPSAMVIDSQSVRTTRRGGTERGFDFAKKVKGRKRHIAVDTQGLLLGVLVASATPHDSQSLFSLVDNVRQRIRTVKTVFADGAYRGFEEMLHAAFAMVLCVVLRSKTVRHFVPIPKRWVVERTFAWFESYRRLSKDFEFHPKTSQTMIYIASVRLMLNRLT
jgi:putative transposase